MDGSDLDRQYHENAERILLQSVAASTMSAHLAAAASLNVWMVTRSARRRRRGPCARCRWPDDLSIIDNLLLRPCGEAPYKRWKKKLDEIRSWDRFDMKQFMTLDQIGEWIGDAAQGHVPRRIEIARKVWRSVLDHRFHARNTSTAWGAVAKLSSLARARC